jgi:hypothetical protein
MSIRYVIDHKLKVVDSLINELQEDFAETEESFVHFANHGAVISKKRWEEIDALEILTSRKVEAFKLLRQVLKNHFVLGNSDKDKDFFKDKIRTEVLPELEQQENYEGCLAVLQFIQNF